MSEILSINNLGALPPQSYQAEFCVDPNRKMLYQGWVKVPGQYSQEEAPSSCYIDMWGEETCSLMDDFQRIRNTESSCSEAYLQDPELFDYKRSMAERQCWTMQEMKKVLQWVFNCFGKLPVQVCTPE